MARASVWLEEYRRRTTRMLDDLDALTGGMEDVFQAEGATGWQDMLDLLENEATDPDVDVSGAEVMAARTSINAVRAFIRDNDHHVALRKLDSQ